MNFSSDNAYGRWPEILGALERPRRALPILWRRCPYGPASKRGSGHVFARPVKAFPVGSAAPAANALGIATICARRMGRFFATPRRTSAVDEMRRARILHPWRETGGR